MFSKYGSVEIKTRLCFADLLQGAAGKRHGGRLLSFAQKLWPRRLIKIVFKNHGLFLLITASK
jgi:hypothetical protein